MISFAVTDGLAIPVEDIASINFHEEYTREPAFGLEWFFEKETVPAKMLIRTYDGPNAYIEEPERAKKFIRSLSSETNIEGAYADDLIRRADEVF